MVVSWLQSFSRAAGPVFQACTEGDIFVNDKFIDFPKPQRKEENVYTTRVEIPKVVDGKVLIAEVKKSILWNRVKCRLHLELR